MSDAKLTQAMAELQEVVRCHCDEAFRDRGLQDPQCQCDSAEAVKVVANRIKDLTAKLAKAEDMMRSLAAMIQHAIGPSKDVFIEPDTGRKLSDAYAIIAEIEGESHD